MIGEVCNGELNIQKDVFIEPTRVKESLLYQDGNISYTRFLNKSAQSKRFKNTVISFTKQQKI